MRDAFCRGCEWMTALTTTWKVFSKRNVHIALCHCLCICAELIQERFHPVIRSLHILRLRFDMWLMKWMLSFGYMREVERISFLSAQSLSCCCYGDFYDGYFWRGCIEYLWANVCVCFFMLSFPVSLSELVIQSSTLSNKRGRKRKRKKEKKETETLGFQNESQKFRRDCLLHLCE